MKETDRVVASEGEKKRNFVLVPLIGVYVLAMLVTLSDLGGEFPFMGRLYEGDEAEHLIFANSIASLYLIVGILKRQRLTLWLLIAYNFAASASGMANLIMLPVQQTLTATGALVPDYSYRINAFCVFVLFLLLNVFLYFHRDRFDNKSIYLW
ncbi:hypothetical protein KOM00_19890 [Geomonas sp. Red69]|uniref:Uncharacterized protein n=1 Tax=Geomonas diazotrophica TaxID=2843197 RepID=A0ABX8JIM2_9BACT|nr:MULTISPECIES: hypothetical protein [Geomonas]MBU5638986.1 hypothetical protein [Geomonas diazotrophica]QWV98239.1 hypothetical protein KP005_02805 [Geomonas nitrogeniifigens]QXE87423.1 hypothetical protein KP003_03170 [Geomonas nitrogeniifigens]